MKIITTIKDQIEYSNSLIQNGKNITFIPTMGNLHKGHESLLLDNNINNKKVVSIYVNPLQFDSTQDYEKYPNTYDKDIEILKKHKTNCLFLPQVNEIEKNIIKNVNISLPPYMDLLCSKYRKGHFVGVFKIVKLLFEIVKPSVACFGEKDYQQIQLVKYIARNYFSDKIYVKCFKTVREDNGLALSSRNNHLSSLEKEIASNVYKNLNVLANNLKTHGFSIFQDLKKQFISEMEKINIRIEYIELLSNDLSDRFPNIDNKQHRLFVAFFISDIRLIDNIKI